MKKEETISRDETLKICKEVADALKKGVLNQLNFLNKNLFQVAPSNDELEPAYIMACSYLPNVINLMNDTIADIEEGRFLPRKEEVTA